MRKKIQTKQQSIDWPVHLSLMALVVVIPLVVVNGIYEPVMMPRLFLLGLLLLAGFSFLLWHKKFTGFSAAILKDKIVLVLGLFAVWTLISQFFAINFAEGLYDTFKTFGTFLLVVFLAHLFSSSKDYKKYLAVYVSGAAVVLSLIALWQFKIHVLDNPGEPVPGTLPFIYKVKATMAHKNQLSIALLLQLPFILYGVFVLKGSKYFLAIAALLLNLLVIALLKTRSVWVGVFLATFVFAALSALRYHQLGLSKILRNTIIAGIIAMMLLPGAVIFLSRHQEDSLFNKIKTTFSPDETRNMHRVKIWDISLRMAAKDPVLGVGAGNWKLEIPRYFNRVNINVHESNWLRPHNDYIWVLAEKGIPGLLMYMAIFALAFYYLHLLANRAKEKAQILFAMLLGAGLTAYLAVSFFTFPYERINHQIYLAMILALVIAEKNRDNKLVPTNKKWISISAAVMAVFILIYSANTMRSEYFIAKAIESGNRGDYQEMADYSKKAQTVFRNLDPEGNPITWYVGSAYIQLGDASNAVKYLTKAARQTPYNMVVMNNLGQALIMKGEYEKAYKALQRSISIFPYFTESLVNISTAAYWLGNYEAAYSYLFRIDLKDRSDAIKSNMQIIADKIGGDRAKALRRKERAKKKQYKNFKYELFSNPNNNIKKLDNE